MVLFCGVVLFIWQHPWLKIRFATVPVGLLLSFLRRAVVAAAVVVVMFVCIALPREPSDREF